MRILYFAEQFPSQSETWVHNEIKDLIELGVDVKIYSTHAKPTTIPEENLLLVNLTSYINKRAGLDIFKSKVFIAVLKLVLNVGPKILIDKVSFRLKFQAFRSIYHFICFYQEFTQFNPDFLYVHFAGSRANIALYFNLIFKKKFFIKMHAADIWGRQVLFELKTKNSVKIFVISEYGKSFLINNYPFLKKEKLIIHTCGIPVNELVLRTLHENVPPLILSTGRLVKMKGFHVLIETSNLLIEAGFDHRIIICGYGPEEDSLANLIKEYKLQTRIFLEGYCSPKKVKQLLYQADLFVLPCIWDKVSKTMDGIPLALMEAMAYGTPVISTKISGIPELIEDGKEGFLAEPNDAKNLMENILKCYNLSQESLDELIQNARKKIGRYYNSKIQSNSLYDYLKIIK